MASTIPTGSGDKTSSAITGKDRSSSDPVLVSWKLGPERMQVSVLQIHCSRPLNRPFIRLKLGDQVYETTVHSLPPSPAIVLPTAVTDDPGASSAAAQQLGRFSLGTDHNSTAVFEWNEAFEFMTNYHTQLFGTLQIDLYDKGLSFLLPKVHIGRAEVKLSLLMDMPQQFISWYELWLKNHTESSLSVVSKRDILSANIGAVQLRFMTNFNTTGGIRSKSPQRTATCSAPAPGEAGSDDEKHSAKPSDDINQQDPSPLSEDEEKIVEASLRFLQQEEAVRHDGDDQDHTTFMDRLGSLLLSKETAMVIKSIRKMLAAFNQGLQLNNSDYLTGIVILERFYLGMETKRTGDRVRNLSFIEQCRRFYMFSMAAYGWKGLNFFGKGKGYLRDSTRRDPDKKCLLEFLRLPADHLLIFETDPGQVFRPGYYVAYDAMTESIVLCIRGTMSTADTLTDLVCDYTPWRGGIVHGGVKSSAEWFVNNLTGKLVDLCHKHDARQLMLVGHSLGGGTASVITMLLVEKQELFRRRDGSVCLLHCYSFAPPPVVSLNLAQKYGDKIDSFVFEDDAVCRLSYGHAMDLRTMIVSALDRSRRAKSQQQASTPFSLFSGGGNSEENQFPINDLAVCRDHIKSLGNSRLGNVKLYLSGTVYFMYYEDRLNRPYHSLLPKYGDLDVRRVLEYSAASKQRSQSSASASGGSESGQSSFSPSSLDPPILVGVGKKRKPFKRVILERTTPLNFDEIIVKRTMLLDHLPNVYDRAFQRAFETLMMDLSKESNSLQWNTIRGSPPIPPTGSGDNAELLGQESSGAVADQAPLCTLITNQTLGKESGGPVADQAPLSIDQKLGQQTSGAENNPNLYPSA